MSTHTHLRLASSNSSSSSTIFASMSLLIRLREVTSDSVLMLVVLETSSDSKSSFS